MKISDRVALASNPFWVSELVGFFNYGYGGRVPFELVYLLAPLVLRKDTRQGISTLNSQSTIYSAFLDAKEKRIRIAGLQKYVDYYKYLAIPSLIVYSTKGNRFSRYLENGCTYNYSVVQDIKIREYCKASHNLGVIFSKEKAKECFYKLGVFNL